MSDSASDGDACVGVELPAEQLPVDVLAVLDGSDSMNESTVSGVSKWSATKAAFRDFLEHAPGDMGFGLSLFPVPGEYASSCDAPHYRDMALPVDAVSAMADGAIARLEAVTPWGQTPTAPALTAALELAQARALARPDRSVIVALATDGLPTACAPTDPAALAELTRAALLGPGHVRTLVVVPGSTSSSPDDFRQVAAAGGTDRPLVIDPSKDFAGQLSSALDAAANHQVACDVALPEPPLGQRLDYDAINVVLEGDSRTKLPRLESAAGCAEGNGWYYDVDPAAGAPSRLSLCRAACERAGSGVRTLRVELGCQTVVR